MKFGFILSVAFTTLLLTNAAQANAQETWSTLPGEFAMRTLKGFYVTAINGGRRRIAVMDPPPPNDKGIQTSSGNYLTAVDGGGRTSDVLH